MAEKFENVRQRYIDELFQLANDEITNFYNSKKLLTTLQDIQEFTTKLKKIEEEIARMKGYSIISTTSTWKPRESENITTFP
jgi:hypothetical protein